MKDQEVRDFTKLFMKAFGTLLEKLYASDTTTPKGGYRAPETYAIWHAFNQIIKERARTLPQWKLYPEERPQKGEYLVDWMIFEESYGPRIACESQWGVNLKQLEWAFDKLRGVKSDVKVLIYERKRRSDDLQDTDVQDVLKKYLLGYNMLSTDEAFLFIEFDGGNARSYMFRPQVNGLQKEHQIVFTPVAI